MPLKAISMSYAGHSENRLHGTAYAPRAQVVHEQTRARGQAHHPDKRASPTPPKRPTSSWSPIKFKNPPTPFLSPSGRRASKVRACSGSMRQPRRRQPAWHA